jgi:hypothetical protein
LLGIGTVVVWAFDDDAVERLLQIEDDEMHQSYVPGRSASKADLVADTAGLVFSLILMPVLIYIQQKISGWIHRGQTL